MTKLRLPKPIAGNVIHRHLHLGSVYTKEQMRAFAEKAVLVEREACAKVCESIGNYDKNVDEYYSDIYAAAIRNRGNT
jgi:hypothetical protein